MRLRRVVVTIVIRIRTAIECMNNGDAVNGVGGRQRRYRQMAGVSYRNVIANIIAAILRLTAARIGNDIVVS